MDKPPAKKTKLESPEFKFKFTTSIPSQVCNVEWNLDHFKAIVKDKQKINSLMLGFEVVNTFDMPPKWSMCLKLDPKDNDSIGVFLSYLNTTVQEVSVNYEFRINSDVGGKMAIYPAKLKSFTQNGWGYSKVFSHSALMGPLSNHLPNNTLTIKLRMEMYGNKPVCTEFTDRKQEQLRLNQSSQEAVIGDISKLMRAGFNPDFVISTIDKKLFHVHRLILGARSPVFKTMFETEMLENATGRVEVGDIGSTAMKFVLYYLYSGVLKSRWTDVADEIVYAADKYDLPLLKKICDVGLIDAVTPETAMNFFVIAKRHNLPAATADISRFIKENVRCILESFDERASAVVVPVGEKSTTQSPK